jgi:peptidyl-prolyl cis-trans isomerase B (cyclophilin B)
MPKRRLPALVLALTVVLAGCGDDSDSATDAGGSASTPAETSASASDSPSDDGTGPCQYDPDGSQSGEDVTPPPSNPTVTGQVEATMDTSVGAFQLTLDADGTPCTVNSFVSLAEQGYYDGTTCHRMTTQGILVLQCGDPTATGSGGPGYSFADELTGDETYPAGTLAMANAGPNTNGSQFFIVYGETPLPPSYTVFGSVDDATVATIEQVAQDGTDDANGSGDGAPNTAVDITTVTVG